MRAFTIAALLTVGCTSPSTPEGTPTLDVTSPARGSTSDSNQVTVSGTATHAAQVTVNGKTVAPGADGTFATTIVLDPGIDIIETHAINGSDDVRDVRSVLSGSLAPTDGSVTSPVAVYASAAALKSIGSAIGAAAKAIDFTAAVQPLNPVYDNGGCLGATIDITNVSVGSIDASLTPTATALDTAVTIEDVVVTLHASYKVACLGGSTTITVKATAAHLGGNLGVKAQSGTVATSVGAVSVALDDFSLDVGGVPSEIASLFDSVVRGKVESALTSVIHDKLPAIANKQLASLVTKPVTASILGTSAAITAAVTDVTLSPTGVYLAIDTTIAVSGGTGAMALSQPILLTPDLVDQAPGLGIAIANDAVNQLFGGLWAAGAFDKTLPIASVGPLAAILDPAATTLDLQLSLPPTVTSDSAGLELAIGDLLITTHDDSGAEIQEVALSLATSVMTAPSQDGKLVLTVGAPDVHAQVVAQAASVARPLTDSEVEGIVTSVWTIVGDTANTALGKLPLPGFGGIELGAPTITGQVGYVVADIAVP